MLRVPQSQTACHLAPADHSDRSISGRRLSRLTKDASAKDRALADALEQGALRILDPTRTQAAALTKSSPSYVAAVAGLREAERTQLARGQLSLARVHKRRHRLSRPTTKSTASSPSLERSGFSPRSIAQRPRRQRRTPTTAERRTS